MTDTIRLSPTISVSALQKHITRRIIDMQESAALLHRRACQGIAEGDLHYAKVNQDLGRISSWSGQASLTVLLNMEDMK